MSKQKRWTIKELQDTNDTDFIQALLQERLNELTNPYSPMSEKLQDVINRINPGMEIQKTLVMSTGHITSSDNDLLKRQAERKNVQDLIVDSFPYGYNIYVNLDKDEPKIEDEKGLHYSDAFKKLMRHARKLNCNYLKLDQDGEQYHRFETFNW